MSNLASTLALLPSWLNPEHLLDQLGGFALLGVALIIFAECGLLIGFFLPGDSLLFALGLFIASGAIDFPIWLACVLVTACAIVGNLVGYWVGYKVGPPLFHRPDSRFFKQEYVQKTHDFFEKYGPRAIILARFVPIVRTVITALAGVARMDFRVYAKYSAIGGLVWGTGVTLAGYYLGQVDVIRENVELIAVLIVAFSVIPIAIEFLRRRAGSGKASKTP